MKTAEDTIAEIIEPCPDCETPMTFSHFGRMQGEWWFCANPECGRLKPLLILGREDDEEID